MVKDEWLKDYLGLVPEELQKKWIRKAVPPSRAGKFGAWCKRQGFKGVCQECINKAARAGGTPAKMALFAVNVSKGKYHWPKKKKLEEELQRGEGRGVGGPRQGIGPASRCVCPECGYSEKKTVNVPCQTKTCPKCGTKLVGKD